MTDARFGRPERRLLFANRHDAGRQLAALLTRFEGELPVVLAIPRGGVPVAAEIADALSAPLDLVVVRKIGAPGNPEYGIGAVAEGGVTVLDEASVRLLSIGEEQLRVLVSQAQRELHERLKRYEHMRSPLNLSGRTAVIVDDGLATGRTAIAAARSVAARGARRVILAVPVAARSSIQELRGSVDEVVAAKTPKDLWAIGLWYEDFSPTGDAEIAALLGQHADVHHAADEPIADPVELSEQTISAHEESSSEGRAPRQAHRTSREVRIEVEKGVFATGDLALPPKPCGVVAFAHGSGSSRLSPRNQAVAAALNAVGIGTLLFDLLAAAEEQDPRNVFDTSLLARRLLAATRWLCEERQTRDLALGCFGASTGAAAALIVAAQAPEAVRAVVSRGGRPDLAIPHLARVRAPTLLIVGGDDPEVLKLNRDAQTHLRCLNELAIIPGATHLFEEPGALDEVSRLAGAWFTRHLAPLSPTE